MSLGSAIPRTTAASPQAHSSPSSPDGSRIGAEQGGRYGQKKRRAGVERETGEPSSKNRTVSLALTGRAGGRGRSCGVAATAKRRGFPPGLLRLRCRWTLGARPRSRDDFTLVPRFGATTPVRSALTVPCESAAAAYTPRRHPPATGENGRPISIITMPGSGWVGGCRRKSPRP